MSGQTDLTNAVWRRSSHSGGNGNCVEVATVGDAVALRDSKDPDGPKLTFSRAVWSDFVATLKNGS
ncbi:DUF397 domain-containing protein [Streptosporangium sp. NPDC051022]|uniref:DUF397 domain-containing protein n=1 Tax=Streptosporangium sp. NPDC051022 TaxID=3155752 RepID=UPI0034368657